MRADVARAQRHLVVEGDERRPILRREQADERAGRLAKALEPFAADAAAHVEGDRDVDRLAGEGADG